MSGPTIRDAALDCPVVVEPVWVSIEAAAALVGLGRTLLLQLVYRGEIRSVTIGRRRLIPVAELRRWARALEAEAGIPAAADNAA